MKRLPLYLATLLCGLFAVASLSSCLNGDDEDYSINATQQKQYQSVLAMTSGRHNANYYYTNSIYDEGYTLYDSIVDKRINVRYYTDSTMTISNFPVSKLDSMIYVNAADENSTYRQFYEALKASDATLTLSGIYCIVNTSYTSDNYYYYSFGLADSKTTLYYGGKEHEVTFKFTTGLITYDRKASQTATSIYLSDILLDYTGNNQSSTSLKNNEHLRGGGVVLLNF